MAQHKHLINILYWNANGIQHKIHELYDYMTSHHIHIACLNETHLKHSQKLYSHPDYITHRLDRSEKRLGGVAIIVKNNVKHKLLPHSNTQLIENISIEVSLSNGGSIIITSVYLPGGTQCLQASTFLRSDIRKLTNSPKSYFICGDLNARHRSWNCYRANKNGNLLFDEYCNSNFLIKHPNEFTRYPYDRRSNPSTIDLVLTNGLHTMSDFKCTPMSSDHMAIIFSIHSSDQHITQNKNPTFNYKLADWNMFRRVIHYHANAQQYNIENINTSEDIDNVINKFTETIEHAKNRAIPKTFTNQYKLILPDDVKQSISNKNTLRRSWQQTRNPFTKTLVNSAENEIKLRINALRNESWQYKLQEIRPSNQSVWPTARLIKNSHKFLPPLAHDGKIIISPEEKAETIGNEFYKNHINPLQHKGQAFNQHVVQTIEEFLHDDLEACNDFTDEEEIKCIIRKLKNSKAPGIDDIKNNLLKNLPARGIKVLVTIINACLKLSYFPERWKHAKVIPILKPGKDATLPQSYRPISLLCALSKILERVILVRINNFIDDNEILPNEQHGFRTKFSTTKQLHKLIKTAKESLANNKSTGVIMLDVEKAFDRVWHKGLIYKMIMLNFPHYITTIVNAFLHNRYFQVDVKGHRSKTYDILAGLPQGAVMSPTLYNIYTHDIPKNQNTNLALFADDTAFSATASELKDVILPLKEHAQQIQDYMTKWKISINKNKTQAIFITRRLKREIPRKRLYIFNTKIRWSKEAKYLGFVLDKRLTIKQHIDYVIKRTNVAIHTLYPLINKNSKLDIKNKLLIYKVAIRPIFTYACPAFIGIAKTHIRRLQIQQNKALKMILNADRYERTLTIHETAKVQMVGEYINKLTDKFNRSHNY